MNVNPHARALVYEIKRLDFGGKPHAADSPEAMALDRAVHHCAQAPDTAELAAIARRVINAALAGKGQAHG
jgi:hypothetical protein